VRFRLVTRLSMLLYGNFNSRENFVFVLNCIEVFGSGQLMSHLLWQPYVYQPPNTIAKLVPGSVGDCSCEFLLPPSAEIN
jgi:hypothetical protein